MSESNGVNLARETPESDQAFRAVGIKYRGFQYVPLDEMQRLERDYNIVKIGYRSTAEELKQMARKLKEVGA